MLFAKMTYDKTMQSWWPIGCIKRSNYNDLKKSMEQKGYTNLKEGHDFIRAEKKGKEYRFMMLHRTIL